MTAGLAAVVASLSVFARYHHPAALILNGMFLGILSVEIGFLTHDAAHRALFERRWMNELTGLVVTDVLNGVSFGWYLQLHRGHHAHSHREMDDPDLELWRKLFAISPESAAQARGIRRWMVRFQGPLFLAGLPALAFNTKILSAMFLIRQRSQWRLLETGLLAIHYAAYFWFFFHFLTPALACTVIVIHQIVSGLHFSAVLLTNHFGLPFLDDQSVSWLERQTRTSRNIRTHPLLEFLFGSLNHQVEHHLFPQISRYHLRRAVPLVREFCREYSLPYHEADFWTAWRDVYVWFSGLSRPAWTGSQAGTPVARQE